MKIYHTVVLLQSNKDNVLKTDYKRVEDNYYESADYYEKYYTDSYSHPEVYNAVVINQFTTEEGED